MSNKLEEAGIALASSNKSKNKQGDVFLDRTIYHTVEVKDSEGRVVTDRNGDPIVRNQAYLTMGRWITESMMEKAMEVEKRFAKLNKLFRDDMDSKKQRWRIKRTDITAISINGVV